ncbi:MAG: hypothetical protein K9M82_13635 [Deltaproteobacteria bacterium]|nr:hypothetical protein [Deltaproteobacteria bacterium]
MTESQPASRERIGRHPGDWIPRGFNLLVALVSLILLAIFLFFTESGDPLIFNYSSWLLMLMGVLAVVLAAFGRAGLKGKTRTNQNLMLVCVSLVMGFLFCEIALRIMAEDPWQKFRVIRKMREKGVDIYPSINPFGERLHRLAPVPDVYTLLGNEGYGWIKYHADENGFRNPKGLYSSSERLDAFAVGDSFTMGCDVPDESYWINRIREDEGMAIYSAGVAAASPIQELARLMEYGIPKRPRVVLWVFYDNDYKGLQNELKSPFLLSYMPPGLEKHFTVEQRAAPEVMSAEELKAWIDEKLNNPIQQGFYSEDWRKKPMITILRRRSRLVDQLIELTDRQVLFHEETLEMTRKYSDVFRDVLAAAGEEVRKAGGELVFVYLPGIGYWLPETRGTFMEVRRRTLEITSSLGVPVIDFKEAVDRRGGDPFRMFSGGKKGGHYSKEGYRALAEVVGKDLRERLKEEREKDVTAEERGKRKEERKGG